MSPETVQLLLGLLDQVSLPGSAPDLEEQARKVATCRRELQALLENNPE